MTRPDAPGALTVDVEDWFQVFAFDRVIARDAWGGLERRVEANTDRILGLMDAASVRGTFFTLGWVAERAPALVRRIVAAGHELASHGDTHTRVDRQTPAEFRADVSRARKTLEDVGGVPVIGYRACTFSIGAATPWAFDVLAETGHRYSSSIYPVAHDTYGMPTAPRLPFRPGAAPIIEVPMTTARWGGRNVPAAGGGYFRLLPYAAFRRIHARARAQGQRGVFYTHPWEFDPGQPRVRAASRAAKFRHYVNLSRTEHRFARLLRDFRWDRMDTVYADAIASVARAPVLPAPVAA